MVSTKKRSPKKLGLKTLEKILKLMELHGCSTIEIDGVKVQKVRFKHNPTPDTLGGAGAKKLSRTVIPEDLRELELKAALGDGVLYEKD